MTDKNTTFDSILIYRKQTVDTKTNKVHKRVSNYAASRDIPAKFSYPDNIEERVLIVSIGGDGTMLSAMRDSANYVNSTVFGLNTGTLGFLTEEVPVNLDERLDDILYNRNVMLEKRMLLSGTYSVDHIDNIPIIDGKPLIEPMPIKNSFKAINEFVVTGKSINAPLITEVFINEHFVSKQLGNGVLVGSSTGSTAMSLSAGGAIVSPSTNIMQIVPLVPHTLTSRPIISTGRDSITIRALLTDRVSEVEVHADGQVLFSFNRDDGDELEFTIKKHKFEVKIWRPADWNFFDVLASKMKW